MIDRELDETEVRVLGCLIEKELTTPDYYPLTLNSLVTACNQKSNRSPVVQFEDVDVVKAVDALKLKSLVMAVYPSGSRAAKYKHVGREKLDLLDDEIAVICELLIRGPQTVGELRTHCERMYAFESVDDVRDVLLRLSKRDPAMTQELPRMPGQKEPRWTHLLSGAPDLETLHAQVEAAEPARVRASADEQRLHALETEVAALREQVEVLTQQLNEFRRQFD